MMELHSIESTSSRIWSKSTNLLANYVKLASGVPTRLHFTDHYYVKRVIADKETGKEKTVESLVFWVDALEGEPAARTFSILSQKLAAHLEPFIPHKEYSHYDFLITQIGEGFLKDWNFQPIHRNDS